MEMKYKLAIALSMGVFFVGCTNPSFNPNNKQVVFIEGKSFRIPYNATSTPHRYTSSAKDKERISIYNKYGMRCKNGDILWIENFTSKEAVKVYKTNGKIAGYNYVGQVFSQGKSGCSKPLSNQEYNFYRGKEMEASANARATKNFAAAMTPQTVNVNHSGTVYQNVNLTGTMNHNVNHTYNPYRTY